MTIPEGTEDLIGTHYRSPDYFEVGREKIREFAQAVKDDNPLSYSEAAAAESGYDSTVASLTFLAVAGRRVQMDVFTKFDIPINLARVLHRDQKIIYHRPIQAGDRLAETPIETTMSSIHFMRRQHSANSLNARSTYRHSTSNIRRSMSIFRQ